MKTPKPEIIERLREDFPVGCRVELLRMDDVQAPPIGTKGTVTGVDDTGSLLMKWDNGSGLNVVYGEDAVRKLDPVKVTCYGRTEEWEDRLDAIAYYRLAFNGCDPNSHEHLRYITIWDALIAGEKECRDE